MTTTIGTGETNTVASGETENDTTFLVEGTLNVEGDVLASDTNTGVVSVTDTDRVAILEDRQRFGQFRSGKRTRSIASGETVSIDSEETLNSPEWLVEGSVTVAGEMQATETPYDITPVTDTDTFLTPGFQGRFGRVSSTDTDTVSIQAQRDRSGSVIISDTDTLQATITMLGSVSITDADTFTTTFRRFRNQNISVTDTDSFKVANLRFRNQSISIQDVDSVAPRLFVKPASNETDPVEIIVDLLENIDGRVWTNDVPKIYRWSDVAQSERGPGDGQPPEIYVAQLVPESKEEFDAEASHILENGFISLFIFSYDRQDTFEILRNVEGVLELYMRDNYSNINLHQITPSETTDNRDDHLTRTTDYFVEEYEIGFQNYRETRIGL